MIDLSIIIVNYNVRGFLEALLQSVERTADGLNVEICVVDNHSTDGSVEVIDKYADYLAWWCSEEDQGQSDAINKGWRRATGDFLGWINSDDLLTPGSIGAAVGYFREHPEAGFVFGDLQMVDYRGRFLYLSTYRDFDLVEMVENVGWISQPGNLFRRRIFEQVGLLDTSLHFMMDFDLWLRAALVCQFGYLRQPVARFRRQEEAKSSSRTHLAAEDILVIYSKLFDRADLPAELLRVRQQTWGSAHLYASGAWFHADRLPEARSELLAAYQANPRIVLVRPFWRLVAHIYFASAVGARHSRIARYTRRARRVVWSWRNAP